MASVMAVYRVTRGWPKEEQYGLTAQVRRAAVSMLSTLAEGHGRPGAREFAHHASIAYGSLCEVQTQILIAESLGYSSSESTSHLLSDVAHVRRLLPGLFGNFEKRRADHDHPDVDRRLSVAPPLP